jgi:AraC-like DNA-binding protein
MDIIWDGASLFVAGPDTVPDWSAPTSRFTVGVRFRPGAGPLFLGLPAALLRDQRVELEMFWAESDQIADALAMCSDLQQCAGVLVAAVERHLPDLAAPDPVVEAAVRAWAADGRSLSTARLSELAGLSQRQLHRRFLSAIGYGPKFLQRVLRFQAFLGSCRDVNSGLADLASRSGYADQAHLNREARLLGGLTPTQLRAARQRVRNVQDREPIEGLERVAWTTCE